MLGAVVVKLVGARLAGLPLGTAQPAGAATDVLQNADTAIAFASPGVGSRDAAAGPARRAAEAAARRAEAGGYAYLPAGQP